MKASHWLFCGAFSLLTAGAGFVVGFATGTGRLKFDMPVVPAAPPGVLPPLVPVGPIDRPGRDKMNWQDLQDFLAANGLKTTRRNGRFGMWFSLRGEMDTQRVNQLESIYDAVGQRALEHELVFLGKLHATPAAARDTASAIRDTHQRDSFAWGRFIFDASPQMLGQLREILK